MADIKHSDPEQLREVIVHHCVKSGRVLKADLVNREWSTVAELLRPCSGSQLLHKAQGDLLREWYYPLGWGGDPPAAINRQENPL